MNDISDSLLKVNAVKKFFKDNPELLSAIQSGKDPTPVWHDFNFTATVSTDVAEFSEIIKSHLNGQHPSIPTKTFKKLPESLEVKTPLDIEKYRIFLSDDIQDPQPIFKVNGTILCSPGNILVIKAKQKAGKTILVNIFIAAYFTGKYLEIEGINTGKSIAWIDTEQSKNQLHKIYKRTHSISGFKSSEDNSHLRVYYAAEMDVPERLELFESLARNPEIGIIIVDVTTDLIDDINDAVETKKRADQLQKIAKENNILIIGTIHENKQDSNATGHFGGSLQKKAECVISLLKADGIFSVTATDTRHGDWPDFSFNLDENGYPVAMEAPVKLTAAEVLELKIQRNLNNVLSGQRLTRSELTEKYVIHDVSTDRTARRHIKIALDKGWIKIQNDNRLVLTKNDNENDI